MLFGRKLSFQTHFPFGDFSHNFVVQFLSNNDISDDNLVNLIKKKKQKKDHSALKHVDSFSLIQYELTHWFSFRLVRPQHKSSIYLAFGL